MQETKDLVGKLNREFFSAPDDMVMLKKMDDRLDELKQEGHTLVRRVPKIGRNQPCPCGSGKKFKKCCIALVR